MKKFYFENFLILSWLGSRNIKIDIGPKMETNCYDASLERKFNESQSASKKAFVIIFFRNC